MVNHYYFDTSALVKRYFPEAGSALMDGLFKQNRVVITASLTYAEVYSAISRLHREAKLSETELASLSKNFEEDWAGSVIVDFTAEVRKKTPGLLRRFPLRGADAVHLASAITAKERGLDLSFVVCDGKLFSAAKDYGLTVINPLSS